MCKALQDVFGAACELDSRAANDPEGIFPIDAVIHGLRRPLGVAITPGNLQAERAVATKLHAERAMKPTVWIALPRDIDDLETRTRSRLMSEFYAPIPRFADGSKVTVGAF